MTTLFGNPGCGGRATAINNRGQVVGYANFGPIPSCFGPFGGGGPYCAFLYSCGTLHQIGDWEPIAINERGTIVGSGGEIYRDGKMAAPVPVGEGVAKASNDWEEVVVSALN